MPTIMSQSGGSFPYVWLGDNVNVEDKIMTVGSRVYDSETIESHKQQVGRPP
jgi:hypothetical protein